jgi:hypothetical protein
MFVDLGTRPKDCQQKDDFKMKTLNIQAIFAPTSGITLRQHFQKPNSIL